MNLTIDAAHYERVFAAANNLMAPTKMKELRWKGKVDQFLVALLNALNLLMKYRTKLSKDRALKHRNRINPPALIFSNGTSRRWHCYPDTFEEDDYSVLVSS